MSLAQEGPNFAGGIVARVGLGGVKVSRNQPVSLLENISV